jgi:hypothetical protein
MSFIKNKNIINSGGAIIAGNNVFGGNIISTNKLVVGPDSNFFYGKTLEGDLANVKNVITPIVNVSPIDNFLGNISVNNLQVINYGVVTNGVIYNFQSSNCSIEVLNTNQLFNNKATFNQVCGNVIQSNTNCTNQLVAYNSTITNSLNKYLTTENGNIGTLNTVNGNINIL